MWVQPILIAEKSFEKSKVKINKKLINSVFDNRYLINAFSFTSNGSNLFRHITKEKSGMSKSITDRNTTLRVNLNMNPNTITLRTKTKREANDCETRNLIKFCNIYDSYDQKENEMETQPCFLIELESKFQQIWEFFLISTTVYSAFFFPISLCFKSHSLIFIIIDILIEVALIADIFLSFFTQFEDAKDNIISSSEAIIESYLIGWFFLDVITCFPATLIEIFISDQTFIVYLKWFSLVRLLKIFKYPYLTHKNLIQNDRVDRILKQVVCLIIMVNIFSCFFIFIGLNSVTSENWIEHSGINRTDNFAIYLGSVYFHFLNFFSLGFAGIEGVTSSERIYTIFILIIDFMLFPFIIISISKAFIEDKPSDINYNAKINVLRKVHKKYGVQKKLRNTISQQLKIMHEKQFELRRSFFDDLPLSAKHMLNNYIYKNRIISLNFFAEQSYDFILYSIPFLKHSKLRKHQNLYNIGEKVDEMFMVIKGSVCLRLGHEFSSLVVGVLRQNSHFGDTFLVTGKTSPFECLVKSNHCEIFSLSSQDFSSLKTLFPKNILSVIDKSLKNLEFFDQRKKNLINLFELEKTKEKVLLRIREIENYLFKRDFDQYFNNNYKIEGVNEFLINNTFQDIKDIFKDNERKNKGFDSERNRKISQVIYQKILDRGNYELDDISKISKGKFNSAKSNIIVVDDKSHKGESIDDKISRNSYFTANYEKKKRKQSEISELEPKKRHKSECVKKSTIKKDRPLFDSKTIKNLNIENSINLIEAKKKFKIFSEKKKEQSMAKFVGLLRKIYKINFQQELDLNSLKLEKEINQKVSKIVVNNQKFENIVNCMEPEFKMKYKSEFKDKFQPVVIDNNLLSSENLLDDKLKKKDEGSLKIRRENSIQINGAKGNKKKLRFKNLKIEKTQGFKLNAPNYDLFYEINKPIHNEKGLVTQPDSNNDKNKNFLMEVFCDSEMFSPQKKELTPQSFKKNLKLESKFTLKKKGEPKIMKSPSFLLTESQTKLKSKKLEKLLDMMVDFFKIQ